MKKQPHAQDFFSSGIESVKSLREIAVEKIKEAIVSGYFLPGDHLKERELSQLMGISTTPIKEAFRILGNEGFVKTVARKGTYVSEYANTSIEEILLLRASIEGLCCRLAAMKMSESDLELLEKQVEKMQLLKEENNTEALVEQNSAFHEMIVQHAENAMIKNILDNVKAFDHAFRKRALSFNKEVIEGYVEHEAIFEAIKNRDPDQAEQLMKQHILRTTEFILSTQKD
ncbi:GntR family transcriptional regulator [Alkalicoccobacillus murimartini]|uniref:DNA-binding GntR family transcriptional regulator n=1 Tax=Alkalicoccobacillus murimartini TaxID=171685 RepID=A0ABT9YGB2_9BACI|nr:GntR family transcriptional regulator [Alkalicoccobacillus murimartini]MDQ0206882.1 DNA-binding GntR family transcriptional regulator [Alkalicoccobacillus murimartini]